MPKKQTKRTRNFFTKTLQRQILIPFITLILVAGAVIGTISYTFSVSLTTKELTENVESQTKLLNESFETFLQSQEQTISYYAEQEQFTNFENQRDEMMNSLEDASSTEEAIQTTYLGTEESGEMLTSPELDLPEDFDPRTRPWYKTALENTGEVIWTEPYIDADSGELTVSAAKTVTSNGTAVGVLGFDINMQAVMDMVKTAKVGETGYAAVMDQTGKFILHPDSAYIGKDFSSEDFYEQIIAQKEDSGTVDYELEGQEKALGYSINDRMNWIIIGTVNKEEFAKKAQPILIPIAISLIIVLLLSALITLLITKRITKPISTLKEKMKQVEEGDLSINLENKNQDEIGQLARSVEQMKESLRSLIHNVSEASQSLSGQSAYLTQAATEVREGSEQIASTMQELSAGAESQATSSTTLSEMMTNFVQKIDQAHQSGEQISETSAKVLNMTNEGSGLMTDSVMQMKNIELIVKEAVSKVQGLDAQSKEISKLIQVINEIAEQTNLLSLNAAIEAARAGEHGKGFAVVADEVRKLAEQVSSSVGDITEIVSNIQSESSSVAKSLEAGYQEVDKGSQKIGKTGETFGHIDDSVKDMVKQINEITDHLQEVSSNSQQMNESIQEIAAVSEESAAGVEEVAASTQQSSTSMEEVSNSAIDLEKLSSELNEQVGKFKI
ncbi:methyl-accepting chemotaxis protein [Sediminibacillus massiliensis]|uniref:methyl-accepting chemotaxis protein n=1 Tax=Sediminibacillus massiliensis TaxID=1926277 RepID=UPI0011780BC4|nr:methyl-accepting chemotaxis protein [Sediminibacillus massiliensis]